MRLSPLLFICSVAFAQTASRIDPSPVMTVNGSCQAGQLCPALLVPGATIQVCSYPSCTAPITTYIDSSESISCPIFSQVTLPGTTQCQSTAGPQGQFGFWVDVSIGMFTITWPNGNRYGPFPFTAGNGSGGASIVVSNTFTTAGEIAYVHNLGVINPNVNCWDHTTGVGVTVGLNIVTPPTTSTTFVSVDSGVPATIDCRFVSGSGQQGPPGPPVVPPLSLNGSSSGPLLAVTQRGTGGAIYASSNTSTSSATAKFVNAGADPALQAGLTLLDTLFMTPVTGSINSPLFNADVVGYTGTNTFQNSDGSASITRTGVFEGQGAIITGPGEFSNNTGSVLAGFQTGTSGTGVLGQALGGTGATNGVVGQAAAGNGVLGIATTGIGGQFTTTSGTAVSATATGGGNAGNFQGPVLMTKLTASPVSGSIVSPIFNANVAGYSGNTFQNSDGSYQVTYQGVVEGQRGIFTNTALAGGAGVVAQCGSVSPLLTCGQATISSNFTPRSSLTTGYSYLGTTTGNNSMLLVDNGGTCTIGTGVSGISCTSDRAMKRNIRPLGAGFLSRVERLRPVTFQWKAGDAKPQSGFVAQDLQSVFPDLVQSDGEHLQASYIGLIPYLVKAIQEQQAEIEFLKKAVAAK